MWKKYGKRFVAVVALLLVCFFIKTDFLDRLNFSDISLAYAFPCQEAPTIPAGETWETTFVADELPFTRIQLIFLVKTEAKINVKLFRFDADAYEIDKELTISDMGGVSAEFICPPQRMEAEISFRSANIVSRLQIKARRRRSRSTLWKVTPTNIF